MSQSWSGARTGCLRTTLSSQKRVGELENFVERAPLVTAEDRPEAVNGATRDGAIRSPGSTLAEIERHPIQATLAACGGNSSQVAQMLGISVRKVQYRLLEYWRAREIAAMLLHESHEATRCFTRPTTLR